MPAPAWTSYPLVAAEPQARSWLTLIDNLGRSPATVDAYGRGLDQYLRFCRDLGIDAVDATLEHVSLFVRHLRGEPGNFLPARSAVSNATLQQRVTAVRLYYDHLVYQGLRGRNPVPRGRPVSASGREHDHFVNAAKGISALQLARDLDLQYKTAFVLAHKLREAISAEQMQGTLSGTVEVDGAYFGGHAKRENVKAERKDARLTPPAKRQSVVVLRQRHGKTLPFVVVKEADGVTLARERIAMGSIVHADEAPGWDRLHAYYEMHRINHSIAYSLDGACTNWAESYFARLRRAEIGQHHHVSGKYLAAYAVEMAWREDNRRMPNGGLHQAATAAALAHPVSRVWKGYWQRTV